MGQLQVVATDRWPLQIVTCEKRPLPYVTSVARQVREVTGPIVNRGVQLGLEVHCFLTEKTMYRD